MAKQYISLKEIANKLLRHPLMAGISYEAIVDYCVDFMRIIKCPNIFTEKFKSFEIKDYRSTEDLPEDFYEVIQVKADNAYMKYATDSFHVALPYDNDGKLPEDFTRDTVEDFTYKIQGNRVYTSFREGNINMSYFAIPVDEDGFPMIPDNSKFTRALEAYIKKQWFTILFDMGKLQPQILQNTQQEYAWAVGACESEFQYLTLDRAETLYSIWRGKFSNNNQHSKGFSFSDKKKDYTNTPKIQLVALREVVNEDGTTAVESIEEGGNPIVVEYYKNL